MGLPSVMSRTVWNGSAASIPSTFSPRDAADDQVKRLSALLPEARGPRPEARLQLLGNPQPQPMPAVQPELDQRLPGQLAGQIEAADRRRAVGFDARAVGVRGLRRSDGH